MDGGVDTFKNFSFFILCFHLGWHRTWSSRRCLHQQPQFYFVFFIRMAGIVHGLAPASTTTNYFSERLSRDITSTAPPFPFLFLFPPSPALVAVPDNRFKNFYFIFQIHPLTQPFSIPPYTSLLNESEQKKITPIKCDTVATTTLLFFFFFVFFCTNTITSFFFV